MFINGINIPETNVISKDAEEFYISYEHFSFAYGCPTTALVIDRYKQNIGDLFYILKGDHRKQYNSCEMLQDSIRYLLSNKSIIHEYSDDLGLLDKYM